MHACIAKHTDTVRIIQCGLALVTALFSSFPFVTEMAKDRQTDQTWNHPTRTLNNDDR